MNNLKILSLNFDGLRPFCLSKKRSKDISDKRLSIISDWISNEDMFDILLLQGKDTLAGARRISESGEYHCFSNLNASTAILLHNRVPIVGCSFFNALGNSVVIPNEEDYLALFSVNLHRQRQVDDFTDIYLNDSLPKDYRPITSYIVGGKFPSKKVSDDFIEELNLSDVSEEIDKVSKQVRDDSHRLLVSPGLESLESYRQLGLVKEKILTHSPISSVIKNRR